MRRTSVWAAVLLAVLTVLAVGTPASAAGQAAGERQVAKRAESADPNPCVEVYSNDGQRLPNPRGFIVVSPLASLFLGGPQVLYQFRDESTGTGFDYLTFEAGCRTTPVNLLVISRPIAVYACFHPLGVPSVVCGHLGDILPAPR